MSESLADLRAGEQCEKCNNFIDDDVRIYGVLSCRLRFAKMTGFDSMRGIIKFILNLNTVRCHEKGRSTKFTANAKFMYC